MKGRKAAAGKSPGQTVYPPVPGLGAAVSRDKKQYLVGECKFKGRPFSYGEYLDTRAKLSPQKENADFYYALFSESGFDDNVREAARKEAGIYLYSLEQIVAGRT